MIYTSYTLSCPASQQLGQIRSQQPPQQTPDQIRHLNRLPCPPFTLLIRRRKIKVYSSIKHHSSKPLEFFIRVGGIMAFLFRTLPIGNGARSAIGQVTLIGE